jgi:hypothetical protein
MGLTGNFRFRRGLRAKAVLQVEEEVPPGLWSRTGEPTQRWRDATVTDLADPTMRAMLDMGQKPGSRWWLYRGATDRTRNLPGA